MNFTHEYVFTNDDKIILTKMFYNIFEKIFFHQNTNGSKEEGQCDKMANFFAIYRNENLPNGHR